ncbi:PTS transporter subunit EIIB [Bacillus subtilis]|nr:PTS transporter subunit EIIB [Bacillus subtilis]MBU8804442.1 PTS transporter subunit EIIB [Bacillus subtilis]
MSGKVRDYTRLAKDILEAVGGEENVIGASRCATRLRLVLKRSTPKAKDIEIDATIPASLRLSWLRLQSMRLACVQRPASNCLRTSGWIR